MKLSIFLAAIFALTVSAENCNGKKTAGETRLKARLEVKALCMNYTLSLVEGELDKELLEAEWTDESTGKTYTNAFALGSPCNFPESIKEGDEFYFTIDSTTKQDCAVCMAYYPTPSKKLKIKVLPE
ncbi:MAG: hypothetical protein NVV59_05970 [Chitinophagaceae bacterium]|nr:hypothetical protein [Chitinophagaceae bacterium]